MEFGWAWDALKGNTTTLVVVAALVVLWRFVLRDLLRDVRVIVETLGTATQSAKDAAIACRSVVESHRCARCPRHTEVKRD